MSMFTQTIGRAAAMAIALVAVPAFAVTSANFTALPAELASAGSSPLVMLSMGHDHQMYFKAYNDFNDLNGDGIIDKTYDNALDYDGYFDPGYCYDYSIVNNRFEPRLATTNHQCGGVGAGAWSGNFLNWATMTRMDVLRKALYGGKRFSDHATNAVVLERAVLPTDGHAFAKVYSGTDMEMYTPFTYNPITRPAITLCNLTENPAGLNSLSKDVVATSNPPQLLVARGNPSSEQWYEWAASPGKQCQFDEGDGYSPSSTAAPVGDKEGQFSVLVQACVADKDATNSARCKLYPNGSYKPYGVLQSYGENKSLRFGLLTGSFAKHVAGGLLRRNIGYVAGNTVSTENEIDTTTGQFVNPAQPGVISTMNRLRISQYNFDTGTYNDCATPGVTAATFKGSANCADWGNPIAEIYNETLRYFSGGVVPSVAYFASDTSYINGLAPVAWKDPMSVEDSCAECAAIVIGVGANSFDNDDLANAPGVTGLASAAASTNALATSEGISGNFLIGSNGTSDTGSCTLKSVSGSNFGSVNGICDGAPDEEGGFNIAGLAYHANITDLRAFPGNQNVTTYALRYGESLPVFDAGVIRFSPYCAAGNAGSEIPCSLLDVQFIGAPTATGGTLYAIWDDSSYGSDYDRDARQYLEYCVGAACSPAIPAGQIKFTVDVADKSSASRMIFGFVVSGTSAGDGTVANLVVPAASNPTTLAAPPLATTSQYTIAASNTTRLKDPLWYAAKYGGFADIDGGTPGIPDTTAEFDSLDEGGNVGADGIPDNYYNVRHASDLQTRLDTSLSRVLASAALVDNTQSEVVRFAGNKLAAGGFYRAFYYPQRTIGNRSINWAGSVHGLFVDDRGYLREDNPTAIAGVSTPGSLDDMSVDYSVEFGIVNGAPVVTRYSSRAPDVVVGTVPFESLNPLWDANSVLAAIDNDAIVTQRDYASDVGGNPVDAASGRYVFTWIDRDGDGVVEDTASPTTDEVIDFVAANFPAGGSGAGANNFRWLGLTDASKAASVVNFIRGQEQGTSVGYRSRAIASTAFADGASGGDVDQLLVDANGGANEGGGSPSLAAVWRLGDIVNSEMAVVGAPEAVYDLRYGDRTYASFRQLYQNRRQMIYVGGNDGLLHAFNAGRPDIVNNRFDADGHTLGAEMWAYAPSSLLPHLRWLTEKAYPHVFYVDGAAQAFDVNIFTPTTDSDGNGRIDLSDGDYPGGWGTILVVGMRLGGADIAIDTDGDMSNDKTLRSAYIVLDVTNPERPPKLIAEISHPDLNFTTGKPTLVKRRKPSSGGFGAPESNEWLLVFGSGPDGLAQALSTQTSQLFAYDLQAKQLIAVASAVLTGVGDANAFMGDPAVVDWDGDFLDDALYVGTVGGSVDSPTGKMKRVLLDENATLAGLSSTATAATMIDVARPVVAAPTTYNETIFADRWILFGSGRGFVGTDFTSTASQAYYGVREPTDASGFTYGSVTAANLFDVTGIKTGTNGQIKNADDSDVTDGGDVVTTFGDLKNVVRADGGWVINFSTPVGEAAERNFTGTTKFGNVALFTSFQPDGASCDVEGDSFLYGINAFTGIAPPFAPLGTASDVLLTTIARSVVPLSRGGIPGQPQVYRTEQDGPKVYVEGRKGTTTLQDLDDSPVPSGRQSWEEIDFDYGL